MYVIAGLGNPGQKYARTKHNAGFMVIDHLAERHGIKVAKLKHKALVGEGIIAGERALLVKPMTYMNLSGTALSRIMAGCNAQMQDLIVIYDDVDVVPGKIRIRKKGSGGTHNGMRSVVAEMGSDDIPRIRVGIGQDQSQDMADFVLGNFSQADQKWISAAINDAVCAIETIIQVGIDRAMNEYNVRDKDVKEPKKETD